MKRNSESLMELIASLPESCPVCGSGQYDVAAGKDGSHEYSAQVQYGCNARIAASSSSTIPDKWEQQCHNAQKVALKMIEKHGRVAE
jgi:hypothetical protein